MGRDEAAYGHAFRKVRLEVANRYDWTCSWCGQPIDPDAKYPDPGSLAIDHVVPVVEAGPEVPPIEGMRRQHLRCSSSSGSHVSQRRRGVGMYRGMGQQEGDGGAAPRTAEHYDRVEDEEVAELDAFSGSRVTLPDPGESDVPDSPRPEQWRPRVETPEPSQDFGSLGDQWLDFLRETFGWEPFEWQRYAFQRIAALSPARLWTGLRGPSWLTRSTWGAPVSAALSWPPPRCVSSSAAGRLIRRRWQAP